MNHRTRSDPPAAGVVLLPARFRFSYVAAARANNDSNSAVQATAAISSPCEEQVPCEDTTLYFKPLRSSWCVALAAAGVALVAFGAQAQQPAGTPPRAPANPTAADMQALLDRIDGSRSG